LRPVVLTIAGSDPSAGAGIQADLKAIEACGAYAATVITSITVQNTRGTARAVAVESDLVREQALAVLTDLSVRAVKSGMLPDAGIANAVASLLEERSGLPYVLDPVLAAGDGFLLQEGGVKQVLLERLLPLATVVTPNAVEARHWTGLEVDDLRGAREAAVRLLSLGARAVLIKGGHLQRDRGTDLLLTSKGARTYTGSWIDTPHTHGTGCVYASAIAAGLARGVALEDAVAQARSYLEQAIRHGLPLGAGHGPTDPMFALHAATHPPREPGRLHLLTDETLQTRYSHLELARLAAEGGVDSVQLREKRRVSTAQLVQTAGSMLRELRPKGVRLLVNDRVDVAVAACADGVHLGREDLETVTARRLIGDERLVGATANSLEEARTRDREPVDYIGVGPVFGTTSKNDPAPTLGLDGLAEIARAVTRPVIAIGGITAERVPQILAAGAHGVAVLSDVVCNEDPARRLAAFRDAVEEGLRHVEPGAGHC